jgi:hypothetical protein
MVALPVEIEEKYIGFTIASGIELFIIYIYSKYDDTEVLLCQLDIHTHILPWILVTVNINIF